MNWPSHITLRFWQQGKVIHRLLVFLNAKSPIKNDFPLGFFLTDPSGIIRLSREDMLRKIDNAKAVALMDYSGTLEDCNGLEIVIDSVEALNRRIQNLKRFYPEIADEIEKHAEQSCNKNHKDHKFTEQIPIKEEVEIELK